MMRRQNPAASMPSGEGMALYQKFKKLGDAEPRTILPGAAGYLDMWMAVAQAMAKLRSAIEEVKH